MPGPDSESMAEEAIPTAANAARQAFLRPPASARAPATGEITATTREANATA